MTETRVEYAVRYTAPPKIAGAETACRDLEQARRIAETETSLGCIGHVIRRTVTYGEWEPVE